MSAATKVKAATATVVVLAVAGGLVNGGLDFGLLPSMPKSGMREDKLRPPGRPPKTSGDEHDVEIRMEYYPPDLVGVLTWRIGRTSDVWVTGPDSRPGHRYSPQSARGTAKTGETVIVKFTDMVPWPDGIRCVIAVDRVVQVDEPATYCIYTLQ